MKHLFITGCARSGTTLLTRLFHAFEGVELIDHEVSLDDFLAQTPNEGTLVGKRTPRTILSVPLPKAELSQQAQALSSEQVCVANLIRDGRDVVHVHFSGPRVNVNRWIGCILQAQRFRGLVKLEIRYEDLVAKADEVQARISEVTGLTASALFSAYPDFVPAHVFEEPEYRDFKGYRARPIDTASLGHSATEYVELCTSDRERALFERLLRRQGYLGGERELVWNEQELAEDQALFETLSEELGFGCS